MSGSSPGLEETDNGPILDLIPDRQAAAGAALSVTGILPREAREALAQVRETDGFSIPDLLLATLHLLLARYSRREGIRSLVIASSGDGPGSSWISRSVVTRAALDSRFERTGPLRR